MNSWCDPVPVIHLGSDQLLWHYLKEGLGQEVLGVLEVSMRNQQVRGHLCGILQCVPLAPTKHINKQSKGCWGGVGIM